MMHMQSRNEGRGDPVLSDGADPASGYIDRWPARYCILFIFATSLLFWGGIVIMGVLIFDSY